LVVTSATLRTD